VTPLQELWNRLLQVRSLSFIASSSGTTGWTGTGVGTVEVRKARTEEMTFHEKGSWRPLGSDKDICFPNVYRWTRAGELRRLEHLRFGEANPVHLFDLAQAGEPEWLPAVPHVCREDFYSAVLIVRADGIVLRWSIDGPRKRELIEYVYSGPEVTR
jgi:hypothetical protein